MRESRTSGSVRGALSNGRPYRDLVFPSHRNLRPQSWSFTKEISSSNSAATNDQLALAPLFSCCETMANQENTNHYDKNITDN
jgi:hypothetical protein